MSEYTYADVIIDPDDPRVEIGAEYYFGNNPSCLLRSISQLSASEGTLVMKDSAIEAQSSPFMSSENEWFVCLIRKKEAKKKYVPFDLSNEEDRAKLRGAWIKYKFAPGYEYQITAVEIDSLFIHGDEHSPESLLEKCLFIDGTPCGKLVEEE